MGVPKFFRWLSERYPKINQPIECPPKSTTRDKYFDKVNGTPITAPLQNETFSESDIIDPTIPEFDRLYIDMNGIIHGCSHNNADQNNYNDDENFRNDQGIKEEEIFANISYYLDRVVSDIAKPKELIYIAIDGVAPRAKMNQQRSRRFRSGKEQEIALIQKMKNEQKEAEERQLDDDNDYDDDDDFMIQNDPQAEEDRIIHQEMGMYYHPKSNKHVDTSDLQKGTVMMEMDDNDDLIATSNGRFAGLIQTGQLKKKLKKDGLSESESLSHSSKTTKSDIHPGKEIDNDDDDTEQSFHHNSITPGTPFLCRCSDHIHNFIRYKLTSGDPAWKDLKIIFSGPNVPGEGEHKIMDFIRKEQKKQESNNKDVKRDLTRHCLMGQDGDLIMLGLATHEINFCLLREEVVFGQKSFAPPPISLSKNKNTQSPLLNSTQNSVRQYSDNSKFQLLHLNVLRDYIAYEFETKDIVPYSPFHLEHTIDDFVFLTFFVGNDFLPHMPALDIGDGAFDMLFRRYKTNRYRWVNETNKKKSMESPKNKKNKMDISNYPYLTRSGEIVDGKRLETFLMDVGRFEDPYYDWKKSVEDYRNEKFRNIELQSGKPVYIPSKEERQNEESENRQQYREMLEKIAIKNANDTDDKLKPVMTSKSLPTVRFIPEEDSEEDDGLFSQFANLVSVSLSPNSKKKKSQSELNGQYQLDNFDMSDLKGRYYYDKFKFTPLDLQKHQALRKAYIEGLVWNLKYYYQGCISWEWYYPYHYGPMLSDLNNIKSILHQIKFQKGKPLRPFEQLLACMPPNAAHVLPKPYQFLMTDKEKSPIVDYYPEDFSVDMNGKHFPWEAVVLLPFIDSKKLVNAVETLVDLDSLSDDERKRNSFETPYLLYMDGEEGSNSLKEVIIDEKAGTDDFHTIPKYLTEEQNENDFIDNIDYLRPGFTTLRTVPITGLERKKIRINVFGTGSRYRTSVLKMGDFPFSHLPPLPIFAKKFIGTTIHFQYPYFREGFVTAVSDMHGHVRGNDDYRAWSSNGQLAEWKTSADKAYRSHERGDGTVGSGGWHLPTTDEEKSDAIDELEEENYEDKVIITLRPLSHLERLDNGEIVKVYDRKEIRIPLIAALWTPHQIDPRLLNIRARLEKDPFDKRIRGGDVIITSSVVDTLSKDSENAEATPKSLNSIPPLSISSGILPPLSNLNQTNSITSSLERVNELPPLTVKKFSSISSQSSKLDFFSNKKHGNLCKSLTPIGTKRNLSSFSHLSLIERKKYERNTNSILNCSNRTRLVARNRGIATVFTLLASSLFASSNSMWQSYTNAHQPSKQFYFAEKQHQTTAKGCLSSSLFQLRSGESYPYDFKEDDSLIDDTKTPPPLEFAHGTTTISFIFSGGIVAAVDSRASMGNFVGSKTTQKVLPINK